MRDHCASALVSEKHLARAAWSGRRQVEGGGLQRPGNAMIRVQEEERPEAVALERREHAPQLAGIAKARGVVIGHVRPAHLVAAPGKPAATKEASRGVGLVRLDIEVDADGVPKAARWNG